MSVGNACRAQVFTKTGGYSWRADGHVIYPNLGNMIHEVHAYLSQVIVCVCARAGGEAHMRVMKRVLLLHSSKRPPLAHAATTNVNRGWYCPRSVLMPRATPSGRMMTEGSWMRLARREE